MLYSIQKRTVSKILQFYEVSHQYSYNSYGGSGCYSFFQIRKQIALPPFKTQRYILILSPLPNTFLLIMCLCVACAHEWEALGRPEGGGNTIPGSWSYRRL